MQLERRQLRLSGVDHPSGWLPWLSPEQNCQMQRVAASREACPGSEGRQRWCLEKPSKSSVSHILRECCGSHVQW
jgi:hypothetical protein